MSRASWQRLGCSLFGLVGVGLLVFALTVWTASNTGYDGGELGGTLAFGYFALLLMLAAASVVVAMIIAYAHLKVVRILGSACAVLVGAFMFWILYLEPLHHQNQWRERQLLDARRDEIETELYQDMRAMTQDREAALAMEDVYISRMNGRDMYRGAYTQRWTTFFYVHAAYTQVFFEHTPQVFVQNGVDILPYYCDLFAARFGDLVTTDAQVARARSLCLDAF